jgi:hypothetical protein
VAGPSSLDYRSGTRLKAVWRTSPDGTRAFTGGQFGWNGICWFTARRGDTLICAGASDYLLPRTPLLFADDQCTQPVVGPSMSGGRRPVHLLVVPNTCPFETGLFEPDPAAPPPERIYQGDGRRCWLKEEPPSAMYSRAREVREGNLITARVVTGPEKGGWAPLTLETEDGAREFYAWKNVAGDFICVFDTAADGVMRCLPDGAATDRPDTGWFADASCATPAASNWGSSCARVSHATGYGVDTGCGFGRKVYQGGDRLERGYRYQGAACEPVPDTSLALYAIGPEIPPATFPEVKYAPGAGTGRLRPLYVTGMPEPTPVVAQLWDTQLGVRCNASNNRCTPITYLRVTGGFFSDAQCTKHVVAEVGTCTATTGIADGSVTGGGGSFSGDAGAFSSFYVLRGRHTGPVFKRTSAGCAPFTEVGDRKFLVADRLREDELVPMTSVQDP